MKLGDKMNYDLLNFITNGLLKSEKTTLKDIPKELLKIVSYNINTEYKINIIK